MRLFLFFIFITVVTGCTTIEVAKEITKASNSVKKTVTNIVKNEDKSIKTNETLGTLDTKDTNKETIEIEIETDNLTLEIETLKTEKKKAKNLAIKQKKVVVVSFLDKTLDHLVNNLGTPNLLRIDGDTEIARFDSSTCRIFFFFDNKQNIKKVKYFEIRDNKGNLIDIKEQIEECFKDFRLI